MSPRNRYRVNPEYRARCLERVKANHAAKASDPAYRELVRVRKLIWQRRESIARLLEHVSKLERSLLELLEKRDELTLRRRAS